MEARPRLWKTLAAFAILYLVWGSTFLAIRIGVREVPPLLYAAMRFLAAGVLLFGWMAMRGTPLPKAREWRSIALLAFLIFVCDYGLLFWAEQRVPSGIAAVMAATIPVFMALAEIVFLRSQRLTARLVVALAVGVVGVAVLMSRSLNLGGAPIDRRGALAIILGSLTWSIGSVLTRRLPLPASKAMSAGAQMLLGGVFLTMTAAASGEFHGFSLAAVSRSAWLALLYLVFAGSILGFTAYVWLIHHNAPTKVGTYAYVNPVVAVLLGFFFAGESLGARTVAGTACVLVSVIAITTTGSKRAGSKRAGMKRPGMKRPGMKRPGGKPPGIESSGASAKAS